MAFLSGIATTALPASHVTLTAKPSNLESDCSTGNMSLSPRIAFMSAGRKRFLFLTVFRHPLQHLAPGKPDARTPLSH